jgi:hypothetical protein
MLMRRRRYCPAHDHRQVQQFDLFDLPDPASFNRPVPAWQALPEETRRTVTDLMARLLLAYGRADRRPTGTGVTDDV